MLWNCWGPALENLLSTQNKQNTEVENRGMERKVCSMRNQEMSSGLMIIILCVISKHAFSFSETKNTNTKLLNI